MGIINFVIHTVFWALGFFFLFRIPRCQGSTEGRISYPSVSIVIPARNEENVLPILLSYLRNQSFTPDEIIVVVGPSEDNTKHIAEEEGVTVIEPDSLPKGWIEKPWACYQGAKVAEGEILIFLGKKYQIKGRRITRHNNSRQLGVIRNLNEKLFDYLVAVIFDEDFNTLELWKIPYAFVNENSRWSQHQNGHIFYARPEVLSVGKGIERIV